MSWIAVRTSIAKVLSSLCVFVEDFGEFLAPGASLRMPESRRSFSIWSQRSSSMADWRFAFSSGLLTGFADLAFSAFH
eukprot:820552-Amphidinium_carterae.1